jgi:hypothetical protein
MRIITGANGNEAYETSQISFSEMKGVPETWLLRTSEVLPS